jgi:hypothetical protein
MRGLPYGLVRWLGALGLGTTLAASALASGGALAAPQASCTTVQCVITFGDSAIAARQTALTTLGNKVTTQLNAKHLTSEQAAAISSDVSNNSAGLATLKTKLDGETTMAAARDDVKNIFSHFRIFAVVLPRDYHEIWLDVLVNIDARLRDLQPKLDGIVDKIAALPDPDNDGDVAAINAAYADLKAQLTSAEGQIDGAQGLFPSLTPANFDANVTLYKTNYTDFHNDIKSAHGDITMAAKDLHKIAQLAKDLIGEQHLPAGATPGAEP